MTTANIAAKLSVKSGSDLLRAAAGYLTLVAKRDSFTRQELLEEMKSASAYYRKNYATNLSSYLKTAMKDFLSETAKNSFALTAAATKELEAKLADE